MPSEQTQAYLDRVKSDPDFRAKVQAKALAHSDLGPDYQAPEPASNPLAMKVQALLQEVYGSDH